MSKLVKKNNIFIIILIFVFMPMDAKKSRKYKNKINCLKLKYLNLNKNKRSISLESGTNALQVSTNKFTIDDATGNTNIAGTLGVTGLTTLNGSLNMGVTSITNVNLVDGVKVSAHAARHLPGGADPLTTGTPVSIGTSNQTGTASAFALSDHVHNHGNLAGGTLHSNATQSVAGFMSSTDKTKLDTLALSNLTDCDTTTTPPSIGDNLQWDGSNWIPGSSLSPGSNTNYSAESVTATTTTSTAATHVLISGMTITPTVMGTYLIIFEGSTKNSGSGNINTFSIFVNGSQITSSVRAFTVSTGNREFSAVTTAIVNYTTGNIEARWRVSAGTGTITGRSLRAIKLI